MLKYEALFNEFESLIQNGQLKAGFKLPSIRRLSEQHQCSKSTVLKALQELEKRHLIYAVPKSGYYVVQKEFDGKSEPTAEIDFVTSAPSWHQFPYHDFQHCINKAIDTYQQELFIYGTPKGLPSLIKVIQKQLEQYQVFAKEEQIFITSGVQQALSLLTFIPFPNERTHILVEQPSYHLFVEQLKAYKISVLGIQRTAAGIDFGELERIFSSQKIKFFYTMPRFHNPLGTSYSKKDREEILKLAVKYGVYIVEDDYLADFEENMKVDPIFSGDTHHMVIYLKSFSKIMFPGLRIGVAVLPKPLAVSFQLYKRTADIDSSMISQAALEIYIKSGMFERHRNKVRLSYLGRAKLLYDALEKHSAQGFYRPSSICMNAHIVLPHRLNSAHLIKNLQNQQVLVETIGQNYIDGFHQEKIVKINVSNTNIQKLDQGIALIFKELNNKQNYYL
ncbi:PLP-dependent aminotransferase family protein [Peribacillus simplex]|uniref:aminotransferase-like domain-containing protein n=1 Tax=Peribacillus simplex TaxID=1478 RepID=UPI00298E3836|nr:PLP-dependent aminotransferase family protein [Peribacillus simplex]MDW7615377.1 PLP-dependent aminotransferase family protein [Peribacillus simplex]